MIDYVVKNQKSEESLFTTTEFKHGSVVVKLDNFAIVPKEYI